MRGDIFSIIDKGLNKNPNKRPTSTKLLELFNRK